MRALRLTISVRPKPPCVGVVTWIADQPAKQVTDLLPWNWRTAP
jgi:hypothetical protein